MEEWVSQTMKITICDDNRSFAASVEARIRDYAAIRGMEIRVRTVYSAEELLQMDHTGTDVLFLDVEMPGLNGIEAAKELRRTYSDLLIVFVTCWIEYAQAGYRVNAFRYYLKEQLLSEFDACMDELVEKIRERSETVLIYAGGRTSEIPISSILYFEGTQKRSVLLHRAGGEGTVECAGKLSDFEELLRGKGFLRLQKGFLVNMSHIVKISNYYACLSDGAALKVSERQYADIKKRFILWKGREL